MQSNELLTSAHMVKMGLVLERSGAAGGADMWQGMPIWRYKSKHGDEIVFRGTFSNLKLAGYFNSKIVTVGDLHSIIEILTGEYIDIDKLEV